MHQETMSQTETNKTIAEIPERNRLITGTTIPKLIKYKVLKYTIITIYKIFQHRNEISIPHPFLNNLTPFKTRATSLVCRKQWRKDNTTFLLTTGDAGEKGTN